MAGCETGGVVATPVVTPQPTVVVAANPNQHTHNGRSHMHPLPASGKNHQHGGAVKPPTPAVVRPAPRPVVTRDYREPEMIFIRGGTFTMGSPANEKDRNDEERPHSVRIGDFYLGKTEVMIEEYQRCVTAGACKPPVWDEAGSGYHLQTGASKSYYQPHTRSVKQPIVGVSWDDAMRYANWLSGFTGKRYGLPTEAQWEYAARAGAQTTYYWGNQVGKNQANCDGCGSQWDGKSTAPVGRFAANRFGLHDMLGNVQEWTCSEYDKNYAGGEQRCAVSGSRAKRGGSWNFYPRFVRSASRSMSTPTNRNLDV